MRVLAMPLVLALAGLLPAPAHAASCRIVRTERGTVFDSCGDTICRRQPDNRIYVEVDKAGLGSVTGTMTCGSATAPSCQTHPLLPVDSCLASEYLPPEHDGAPLGCDVVVTPFESVTPVAWTVACSVGL